MSEKGVMAKLSKWGELLGLIQTYDPVAHIAGGALRDLRCHRPIKDVDVFADARHVKGIQSILRAQGYSVISQEGEEYFTHAPNTACVDIWTKGDGIPVNVIFQKDLFKLDDQLKRFDFGICQIGFDGRAVSSTMFFLQDMYDAQFVLRGCENHGSFQNSMLRYERLKEKYEEWPLVIPECMERYRYAEVEPRT